MRVEMHLRDLSDCTVRLRDFKEGGRDFTALEISQGDTALLLFLDIEGDFDLMKAIRDARKRLEEGR